MKNRLFIGLLLFSYLITSSCCKKDECKNQTATSAGFKMYEAIGWDTKTIEVQNNDTVALTSVTFEANDSSTEVKSYEWQIGTDPRTFTTKQLKLDFRNSANTAVNIRLILKKNVDKTCFPNDDGVDTVIQRFFVSNKLLAQGAFEGSCKSNPTEKFTIFIGKTVLSGEVFTLDNLPNGCSRKALIDAHLFDISLSYNQIIFGTPNFKTDGQLNPLRCQIPWGKGKIQKDGVTLILDYQIWEPFKKQFINDQFIGVKK
jgi:hypothetical protein